MRKLPITQVTVGLFNEVITMAITSADLFMAILPTADTIQSQKANLANYQLQMGVRKLQDSHPDEAISYFKRALALDSSNVDAYNDLGNTYLQLKQNDNAIDTFKKLVAMKPFDTDAATNLGNAYAQANKWTDAAIQYKRAASLDPSNTTAIYSAGQSDLQNNKLSDAEESFQKIIRMKPNDPNGYYALGQTYNKMGNFDAAISSLEKAVSLKHDFYGLAENELGYAYNGKGDDYLVQRQIDRLNNNNQTTLADQLKHDTVKPKFTQGGSGSYSPFYPSFGPNTPLALMSLADPKQTLTKPDASKTFTMDFQFNTDMDVVSVQSLANWQISKANGGAAGYYNNGYTQNPQKEAQLPLLQSVSYNVATQLATVTFSLKQNATGDAVIDPSHLVFKFSGTDANGKTMDPNANAYDGVGKIFGASKVSFYG
jgi:Flp pilus assembly protein TadD